MADIKNKFATITPPTFTIASLANGAGRASGEIDNSSNLYIGAVLHLKIKTGASGVSATGYVEIYLLRSNDGTSYDDAYAGSDAAYTPVNAERIGIMAAVANATTYEMVIEIPELPEYYAIGIYNATGAALDSTAGSHDFTLDGKLKQTA